MDQSTVSIPPNELIYIAKCNDKFTPPGAPIKCQWKESLTSSIPSPHCTHTNWKQKYPNGVFPNVLSMIGNTPIVKLTKIPQSHGLECNIYAKCEFVNPGGSIKDRMVQRIFEDVERQGLIKPGMTIIEISSGNTGIAVALLCALKGYKCIIVMPEKISAEKESVIRALGGDVYRCAVTAGLDSTEGIFAEAYKLKCNTPNSFILDQFTHPGNPLTHYDATANEILHQLDNKVDMIVLGGGTGGTITGIGRKFREISPQTKIVGFDPIGSHYALPKSLNKTDVTFFEIEGVGYEIVPSTLDQSVCDYWIKVSDTDSLQMVRRMMKEEGLLVGMSSGTALVAALQAAKTLKKGQNCVILLPDSIRNYMTKYVSDRWMEAKGYQPCENKNNVWWWDQKVSNLKYKEPVLVKESYSLQVVLDIMNKEKVGEVAVMTDKGNLLGAVTAETIRNKIMANKLKPTDVVERCSTRILPKLDNDSILGRAFRIVENDPYALVVASTGRGAEKIEKPLAFIHSEDIFEYIQKNGNK